MIKVPQLVSYIIIIIVIVLYLITSNLILILLKFRTGYTAVFIRQIFLTIFQFFFTLDILKSSGAKFSGD